MEDISRELEREIARIKPAPHKVRRENRILIVNDAGEIRSGDFLKLLVYVLLVISILGGLGTIAFYRFYAKAHSLNVQLEESLESLEKKADRLISEKELLMARLVMTGNTAELETLAGSGKVGSKPPQKEKRQGMKEKKGGAESANGDVTSQLDKNDDTAAGGGGKDDGVEENGDGPAEKLPNVGVGSFSLSRGNAPQDIVVRFNIRNTAQKSEEISGRIFCVLRPKGATSDKWVVIPNASITQDGVPGPYKRGHYFSISRFKPVQFTVNTPSPLTDFADASVFIFDETETLLLKTTFDTEKAIEN